MAPPSPSSGLPPTMPTTPKKAAYPRARAISPTHQGSVGLGPAPTPGPLPPNKPLSSLDTSLAPKTTT